jgi:hypothetical protein
MKTTYLSISLALSLFSSVAVIRLFNAPYPPTNANFLYPVVGSCVGIFFGILAAINKDKPNLGCLINMFIVIAFIIPLLNILSVFGFAAFLAQIAI